MEEPMAKRIGQGFSQSLNRDFQFFLTHYAYYLAADGKVLKKECYTGIQEREEIAIRSLVINKLVLIRPTKTGHTQQELRKLAGVMQKQGCCCILQLPI